MFRRPTQVQLMRGEFLEIASYWAGVAVLRLRVTAEKKVSQHSCVLGFSVSLTASPLVVFHTSVAAFNRSVHTVFHRCIIGHPFITLLLALPGFWPELLIVAGGVVSECDSMSRHARFLFCVE